MDSLHSSFSRSGASQNLNGSRDLTTPLSGIVCHLWASTCYDPDPVGEPTALPPHWWGRGSLPSQEPHRLVVPGGILPVQDAAHIHEVLGDWRP